MICPLACIIKDWPHLFLRTLCFPTHLCKSIIPPGMKSVSNQPNQPEDIQLQKLWDPRQVDHLSPFNFNSRAAVAARGPDCSNPQTQVNPRNTLIINISQLKTFSFGKFPVAFMAITLPSFSVFLGGHLVINSIISMLQSKKVNLLGGK